LGLLSVELKVSVDSAFLASSGAKRPVLADESELSGNPDSHEHVVLNALLSTLELGGVLIKADVLDTSPAFFSSPPSRALTCS
jgi:hypothetical protein